MVFFPSFVHQLFGNLAAEYVEPYVLKEDMLLTIKESFSNSELAYWEGLERDEDTKIFEDRLDRAIVRHVEGACYVAFRGSTEKPLDSFQSAPSLFPRKVCGGAGCCHVERGVAGAYFSGFVEDFEAAVSDCHKKCEDGCDMVLTGFSQGGAIASVAAVALADYNPVLITFAQHPVAWNRCDVLDTMETYLRFTSTCSVLGQPAYDSIAYYGNPLVGRDSGTMILVGHGGAATVANNKGRTFFPLSSQCHILQDPYKYAIEKVLAPGPLDGYLDGSMCTSDVECQSNNCAGKRCAPP